MEDRLPWGWEELDLMFRLSRAKQCAIFSALSRENLQDVGQPRILILLGQRKEDGSLPGQQELARSLRVSPATVAASIKSLERVGYIARQSDPVDGRRKRLILTEKGQWARERCIAVFDRLARELFEPMSREELEEYCRLNRILTEHLAASGRRVDCCSREGTGGKEGNAT
ncbi:MAG: winged helix DNA-binding protein [Oscillospiraceae bacterium]|nr:winged helix DNA-binding protein [Oscillospiraceae bacterium]